MNLPDFLTEWPFGEIMVAGHRIGLYHVISRYKEGMNVDQLHDWFDTLEPELIQKVLDFYHANQAEVDRLVQMQNDAVSAYNIPGTPGFLLNGELVTMDNSATVWAQLEGKIKAALGG